MKKIEYERRKRGLSQTELAAQLVPKLAHPDISNLETGRMQPYPGWVERLETYFEMPIDELLAEVE